MGGGRVGGRVSRIFTRKFNYLLIILQLRKCLDFPNDHVNETAI